MSQEQLAEAVGVSRQTVSQWEKGVMSPKTESMLELCRLFGVSCDYLLSGEENLTHSSAYMAQSTQEIDKMTNEHCKDCVNDNFLPESGKRRATVIAFAVISALLTISLLFVVAIACYIIVTSNDGGYGQVSATIFSSGFWVISVLFVLLLLADVLLGIKLYKKKLHKK